MVSTYEEAVRRLTGAGFALWDICESSERKNASGKKTSMDSDIKKLKPAAIEELVAAHPSIRRLVFATGKGSAKIFRDKFADWLQRGAFCCGNDAAFQVFNEKKALQIRKLKAGEKAGAIELIVPSSVSPAACKEPGERNFGEKKDAWLRDVFGKPK